MQRLPAPPRVVWADLANPKREGTRAWLTLLPDEIEPEAFDCDPPNVGDAYRGSSPESTLGYMLQDLVTACADQ
jgi:hypothetical protein